jgi:TonB family protein
LVIAVFATAAVVLFSDAATNLGFPVEASIAGAALQESTPNDDVVTVGGDVKPPRKIKHVSPVYPPEARDARIEGVVVLEVVIGRDGLVKKADVVKSVPELDAAATEAVLQWEFEPTHVKGKAVSVKMKVTVNFSLKP